MTSSTGAAAAMDSIGAALADICADDSNPWDPARRFIGFARRLQLITSNIRRSPEIFALTATSTAVRGVAADLDSVRPAIGDCRSRSRIYVLIHCETLAAELRRRAGAVSGWLALLDSVLYSTPELRKSVADLSRDMSQFDPQLTENEEKVYKMLQREGSEVRESSKAVQSAIVMDLARALGMDPGDSGKLAEQIKLLKDDLSGPCSNSECRILISLEKVFDSWSAEPGVAEGIIGSNFEEEAQISPFKNFICPLTKEVMKDPVVLESSQTYERTAIRYWFERCLEDGHDPTCPVTGQVLRSLELRPNIGLAGAIDEWVNRNVEIQINVALQYLGEASSCPLECIEKLLDDIYRISQEHPFCRYKVRNAGIVTHVVKLLSAQSSRMGTELRSKALMALRSLAKDQESKLIMLGEGITRLVIRSLTGSSEMEKEYALRLLLEFSNDQEYCRKVTEEKGALLLLSSFAESTEFPILSNLAEEILKHMETLEDKIQQLAATGRFQPLISRLSKGSDAAKIEMAMLVGKMSLTNNGKVSIARQGGRTLVNMLSLSVEAKISSLKALYSLSTLDESSAVLVDFGVIPELTDILFATGNSSATEAKEIAAGIIANLVSKSGQWELSFADKSGNKMQSESTVQRLFVILPLSSPKCQVAILKILSGVASSPQASGEVVTCIQHCKGIMILVPYLEHSESAHRIAAYRLLHLLSKRLGQSIAEEFRAHNKLLLLKERLLDTQNSFEERCESACILANLPLLEDEVKGVLGLDLMKSMIENIRDQESTSGRSNSRSARRMVEGLVGLLLHYVRSRDPAVLALVQENNFMAIFLEQLHNSSNSKARQRAAFGLKYLSEASMVSVGNRELEPQPPTGFCMPFMLICGKPPMIPIRCPLHNVACDENSSFCLLKGNAIRPLIDVMYDENTEVQIAAVEALSTIVYDAQSLRNVKGELEQLGLFKVSISIFKQARPGDLQEKVLKMIEKFLHLESIALDYSTDQELVMALVGAMKHGNPSARRYAQSALTKLKQLSGVGSKISNQSQGRENR